MFVVKLFVAVAFVKIQCADCSLYKDDKSCNFKGSLPCRWYDAPASGSKCKSYSCTSSTTQTDCENNGFTQCYWNASASDKCTDPYCGDFPNDATCVTLGASFGLTCKNGYSCVSKGCSDFTTQTSCDTETAAIGLKCAWNGTDCKDRRCQDKATDTKAACEAYESYLGSCKYTAAVAPAPAKCEIAYCADWTAEGQTACLASNGKLDCAWNEAASDPNRKCKTKSCGDFKSESDCDANAAKYACGWYSLYGSGACFELGCSDLDDSKQVCEESHPACHYDGSCKAGGDAANVVGVSGTLSMLLLLLLSFYLF